MDTKLEPTRAAELLGHPNATVLRCDPYEGAPNLWFVRLETEAGMVQRLILLTEGEPFTGTGLAAAGRFLEESGFNDLRSLTQEMMGWFIKAADAGPTGWAPGMWTVVRPFRSRPLNFTIERQLAGATRRETATLARSGGGWAWRLSSGEVQPLK